VATPTLYVVWLLHRGEVTDFHLRVREQRIKPLTLTVITTLGAWLMLIVNHAPYLLVSVATAGMAIILLLLLVTSRWKISGHTTAISGLAMLCCVLLGPAATPVALGVPLVAWARVRLHRHTVAQTIAGAALGILTTLAFYLAFQAR
jgi:membrane-associated phospholipid phosphatase